MNLSPRPVASRTLTRQILSLALPTFGAVIAEPFFILIDSAMVGHLGTEELAGLGLASTILQTIVGLFVFLLFSTTTLSARAYGAGDNSAALRSGINASWLAGALGLIAGILLLIYTDPLLAAFSPSAEVAEHARAYLHFSSPGLVGMFVVYATTGTFRGLHSAHVPLIISSVGALVNIAANAVFIYLLHWGVGGSGAGTALTQTLMALSFVLIIAYRVRGTDVSLFPSRGGVFGSLIDGFPLFIRTIALRASLIATIAAATHLGVATLAAHQIVWSSWSFISYAFDALAVAGQTLFAATCGRGDKESARFLLRYLTRWGAFAGVVIGIAVAFLAPFLPSLFTADGVVSELARAGLWVAAVGMPVAGVVFLLEGIVMGAGKTWSLAIAWIAVLLIYVPSLWVSMRIATSLSPLNAVMMLWGVFVGVFTMGRLVTLVWISFASRGRYLYTF
ncbi:MAG: MATE family efflux transporter [Actinobacteria bacterium]|nr:MAG: MATE family efflux transporter [Actinomycetota bacterium]